MYFLLQAFIQQFLLFFRQGATHHLPHECSQRIVSLLFQEKKVRFLLLHPQTVTYLCQMQ